jgi:TetR/AcrR family transcriptional regulator
MSWQRARHPEQKAARIADILHAAATLLDEKDLSDIAMREVAARSGVGKASLYHYFTTKEAVFLALYRHELGAWLADLETRLGALQRPTPARIAQAMTQGLASRPRFCRLTAALCAVLERNLSRELLVDFKHSLLPLLGRFVQALQAVSPGLSEAVAKDVLFQLHALIAGLWPMGHPSAAVAAVLTMPALHDFRVDFFPLLERTLVRLLASSTA